MCQFGIHKCRICAAYITETITICEYARYQDWQSDSEFAQCPNVQELVLPPTACCDSCSKKLGSAKEKKKSEDEKNSEVTGIASGYRAKQELRIAAAVQAAADGAGLQSRKRGGDVVEGRGVDGGGSESGAWRRRSSVASEDLTWGHVIEMAQAMDEDDGSKSAKRKDIKSGDVAAGSLRQDYDGCVLM